MTVDETPWPDSPLYHSGRVTSRIAPGQLGEVTLAIRGGAEAFLAVASDPACTFERGDIVIVTAYLPPRTVRVAKETTQ
jgi:hypothetical protein